MIQDEKTNDSGYISKAGDVGILYVCKSTRGIVKQKMKNAIEDLLTFVPCLPLKIRMV